MTAERESMDADEAREILARVKAAVVDTLDDLTRLWRQRAWLALGYASWDALCDAEFGVRMALPRDERREAVAELRAEGMSTRAIGSALGVADQTVRADLGRVREVTQSDPSPDRVTSLDGRERPATRPTPLPPIPAPPDPVEAIAESAADLRRLRIRADFMRWLAGVGPFDVDAGEMAYLIEGEDEWARIVRRQNDIGSYLFQLIEARPRGLRAVGRDRP